MGVELARNLNLALQDFIDERWQVESALELELEGLYLRLLLPLARAAGRASPTVAQQGASKRYAGLIDAEEGPKVVFTGMEAVRRDWTKLAKMAQRELYERLFLDQPIEEYLRQLAAELRAGEHDELLIYRKGLRKPPSAYTSTTPPHVVAARKLGGKPPRVVEYLMTKSGPEPLQRLTAKPDYEHYVEKQLKPVAAPLLQLLGLDFNRVVGDVHQLVLF